MSKGCEEREVQMWNLGELQILETEEMEEIKL